MSFRDKFRNLKRSARSRINSTGSGSSTAQLSVASPRATEHVDSGVPPLDAGIGTIDSNSVVSPDLPSLDKLAISSHSSDASDLRSDPQAQDSEPAMATAPTIENPMVQWDHLSGLLRVLKPISGAIPPLRALFDQFVECIRIYESAAKGHEEYTRLRGELEDLFEELQKCFVQAPPPTITISVERLCRLIQQELSSVQKPQPRAPFRYLDASNGSEEVLACYQRIHQYLQRLIFNVNLSIWKTVDNLVTDNRLKLLPASLAACYNSTKAAELKRAECASNTRTDVLAQLRSWTYTNGTENLFWLNGMAGTGKTTIAYTLCTELDSDRKLAASFFCSRLVPECRDINLIIPSIAYQLAHVSKPFYYALSRALERDPDAHARLLHIQFDTLIGSPLAEVKATLPENMVVVIDALDECIDKESTGQILDILLANVSNLPLKFLISSRPEPEIRDKLEQRGWINSRLVLHELDRNTIQNDIQTYLRASLAPMDLSESQIITLTERSGILFIYAATVIRFISYDNFRRNPRARLKTILSASTSSQGFPLRDLDQLYTTILKEALDNPDLTIDEQYDIKEILYTVLCFELIKNTKPQFNICRLESSFLADHKVANLEERVENAVSTELFYACRYWATHLQFTGTSFSLAQDLEDFLSKRLLLWMEIMNLKRAIHYSGTILKLAEDWSKSTKSSKELVELAHDSWRFASTFALNNVSMSTPHLYVSMLPFWPPNNPISKCYSSRMRGAIKVHGTATTRSQFALIAKWKVEENLEANSAAFSSDGTRIIVGAGERVYIMNAFSGKILLALSKGNNSTVRSAILSPDGNLAAACSADRSVCVWEVRNGQRISDAYEGVSGSTTSIEFSPDSSRIVSGSKDGTVRVWDPLTGLMLLEPLEGPRTPVMTVAISSDGSFIAAGYRTTNICLWDSWTGKIITIILAGSDIVTSVSFSFDCTRIASGSFKGPVSVWEVQTGSMKLDPLEGHTGYITSVRFSPDDRHIVSSSEDRSIRFWDSQDGTLLMIIDGHTNPVTSVAFSPDGAQVVSTISSSSISIWDAQSQYDHSRRLAGHSDFIIFVDFSSSGTNIISGSCDGVIQVWDIETGESISRLTESHRENTSSIALAPNGDMIASSSHDGAIYLRDAKNGQVPLDPLEGHSGHVISIQFSPDGTRIASGSTDMTICVWRTQDGHMLIGPLKGHTHWVRSIGFSADGGRMVSGSADKTIIVWNSHNGRILLGPLLGHSSGVTSVKFSPNGTHIVSGSHDHAICVWDAQSGQLLYNPLQGHTDVVSSVTFSHDGTWVASGSFDKTICIWNVQSGQLALGPIKGHTNWISCIAFSPDDTKIVSGSDDKTIRVHDLKALNPMVSLLHISLSDNLKTNLDIF
ncbi:WD repeat-containing protein [Rhizoctonia solani]|uniref:WD repeat-containing protein n=1 Tax=Rhizoctonia solani TaxID=456999 RepID=A0A8H8NRS3_9AGAM|nr:WD repeat-containing protein [Rhizoctonia solani]QRW17256.1 WD repeat-containing protein [Rhizoctonia solani]